MKQPDVRRIHLHLHHPMSGSDYYRVVLPYRHLAGPLARCGVLLMIGEAYPRMDAPHAIHVQRHAFPEVVVQLLEWQATGTRIVFDLDDDLLNVPEWSPAKSPEEVLKNIRALRHIADVVWMSTPLLAERYSAVGDARATPRLTQPEVLPNLVDLVEWRNGREQPAVGEDGEIRILWAGSNTHDRDLALVENALGEILRSYPQVKLVVFGDTPAKWKANWFTRVRSVNWVELSEYPKKMLEIAPHIGICPLVDEPFNHAKSAIKFLEMTLAGAAVIASPLPPYKIETGCMLHANDEIGWYKSISSLIESEVKRREQQAKALEAVRKRWSWQNSPWSRAWMKGFLEVAGLEVRSEPPKPQKESRPPQRTLSESPDPPRPLVRDQPLTVRKLDGKPATPAVQTEEAANDHRGQPAS